jgi:exonuclease VII small subunit
MEDSSIDTAVAQSNGSEEEIHDTDIVFDCPHCNHGLVIDYRGAGLQIDCVECKQAVTVPIPEGMIIDDLDLSTGEVLTQLFQTRRMLLKSEQRIATLEESIESLKVRRKELEKSRITTLHRCAELVTMCQTMLKQNSDVVGTVNRMQAIIAEEQQR